MVLPAAAIFDMDGLLVNTESLHGEAFVQVFSQFGIQLTLEEFRQRVTMGALNTHDLYLSLGGNEETWPDVIEAKHLAIAPILEEKGHLMRGATKLLDALHTARIPAALATSARRKSMEIILTHFSLSHHFAATVALEDVPVGKPDPASFLSAAAKLGAEPETCVVFEDAPKGVLAAHRAGMRCVAVPTESTADGDFSLATLVVNSLEDIDVDALRKLMRREATQ